MTDLSQMSDDELFVIAGSPESRTTTAADFFGQKGSASAAPSGPSVAEMSDEELLRVAGVEAGPRRADPKIGQPEELTWYEKLAAGAPNWMTGGSLRGSAMGGVMHGMAKPVAGAVQWAASVLDRQNPVRRTVDENVRRVEGEYQAARKDAGREG